MSVRLSGLARAVALAALLSGCGLVPPLTSPYSSPPPSAASTTDVSLGLTRYAEGDRAAVPAIGGTTLDGAPLDLASLRGKVVVVNSWASWCAPCTEELPVLVEAAKAASPADVAFVGLNINDTRDAAAAMVATFGIPYPSIVDNGARLLARLPGVPPEAVPSTVVIDRQGRVAARVIGTVKPGMLDEVLAELVAEESATP